MYKSIRIFLDWPYFTLKTPRISG